MNSWNLQETCYPGTHEVRLLICNVYGLLAIVGIGVLYSRRQAKVVRNFLLACAFANVGHLYVIYAVIHQFSEFVFVVLREIFMH